MIIGQCGYIDLRGCSFLKEHNLDHTTEFGSKTPNGAFSLNLSIASDREVANQLLDLAEAQDVLKKATLNNQPFSLKPKVSSSLIATLYSLFRGKMERSTGVFLLKDT